MHFRNSLQEIASLSQALTQAESVSFLSHAKNHTMHVQWSQFKQGMTSLGVQQRLMIVDITSMMVVGEPVAQNAHLKMASIK